MLSCFYAFFCIVKSYFNKTWVFNTLAQGEMRKDDMILESIRVFITSSHRSNIAFVYSSFLSETRWPIIKHLSNARSGKKMGISNRSRVQTSRLLIHPRDKPLKHAFITEHILAEILHHARPLSPEVFNGFADQIELGIPSPSRWSWCS